MMPERKPRVKEEGGAAVVKQGLGEMPLTLWLLTAAVILFLYIRRAHKGIDTHPGEAYAAPVRAPQPVVRLNVRPFTIGPPPVLEHVPGTPNGPGGVLQ